MRIGTTSLVHDIRKRRIEVLGAEVNRQGDIIPQKDRLEDFKARLRHRMAYLAEPGEIITGISNYDSRFKERGRYRFDGDDIRRMLDQFEMHWDVLNRRFTKDFLDGLHRELAADPRAPILGHTNTWVVWLPSGRRFCQARPGARTEEAHARLRLDGGRPLLSTIGDLYHSTVALDGHPALGDQDRGPTRDNDWDGAQELENLLEALWRHEALDQPGHTDEDEDADSTCRQGTRGRQSLGGHGVLTAEDLDDGADGGEEPLDGSSLHREKVVDASCGCQPPTVRKRRMGVRRQITAVA